MRRSLVYSLVGIVLAAVIALGVTIQQGNKPLLGLDSQGGASVAVQAGAPPASSTTPAPEYDAQTCSQLGATAGSNLASTPAGQDNAASGKGYALLPQIDQKKGTVVGRYLLGQTELTGRVVSSA